VLREQGVNSQVEMAAVLDRAGFETHDVHMSDILGGARKLDDFKGLIACGGFSYGDHLRCGALARFSPIMGAVAEFAAAGGPVLGICNGFQILCEADLLPGILTPNHGQRFICRDVELIVEQESPWIGNRAVGTTITVPVKHGDGAWFHPEEGLDELEEHGQVLLRYAEDVNGATRRVAASA
jgi:phosphoribosylformylglycinamidine synthase